MCCVLVLCLQAPVLDLLEHHAGAAQLREGCQELELYLSTAKELLAYLFTKLALLRTGTAQDAAAASDMSPEPQVYKLW